MIPRWIDALVDGRPCVIYGDGTNSRDFCYIDNVVQANLLAGSAPAETTGTVYNVGCNGRTDLQELFALIRDNLAKEFPEVARVEPVFEPPRSGDIAHSQASIARIADALGYVPSHDIAQGMEETVAWFAARRRR